MGVPFFGGPFTGILLYLRYMKGYPYSKQLFWKYPFGDCMQAVVPKTARVNIHTYMRIHKATPIASEISIRLTPPPSHIR